MNHHQVPSAPLLGRGGELRTLRESLAAAADGRPSVVHLCGEAGIGKTSLLEAVAAAAAENGVTVARACGAPLEREFAFGVVRQLFTGLLTTSDQGQRDELLHAAGHPAAVVLGDDGLDAPASAPTSFATHHALYRLTSALAQRSALLLAVDDAQFADAPSLRFLSYAVHRLESMPVLLVVCTNDGQPSHAEEPLQDLATSARPIRLAPLEAAEVTQMVRASLPGAGQDIAAACREVTGGNPFLVTELARTLHHSGTPMSKITADTVQALGSPSVAQRLRSRLACCPEAAALAHAVAALGDRAEFALAADLAGLDLDAAVQALDTLVDMNVLDNTHPLGFTHGFVRNAVLHSTPIGARIAAHANAAQLLHTAHAPAEQIAAHVLEAGSVTMPWAAEVLRQAARQALTRGAPEAAATYLQHALRQPLPADQRAAVLCELGTAELAFAPATGIARLRSALEAAADARRAATVALSLIPALCMAGAHDEAVSAADAVLTRLDPREKDLTWALEATAMVAQFLRMPTVADARARIERMRAHVPDSPDLRRTRLAFLAAVNAWHGHSREQVAHFTRQALAGADQLFFRPPGYYALFALARTDDIQAMDEIFAAADRIAAGTGSPRATAIMTMARALQCLTTGDLTQAARRLSAALQALEHCAADTLTDSDATACTAWLVDTLVATGQLDQARQLLTCGNLATGPLPELLQYNYLLCARGGLRLAEGDLHGAIADLEECGRRAETWQMRNPAALPWRSRAAAAHAALGQRGRARELAEQELAHARQWGTPRTIGAALHTLATATGGDQAAELLTEAVATLETSPDQRSLAAALLDSGRLAQDNGRRDAAHDALLRAADLARQCGAEPLAARAQAHLAELGTARKSRCRPHGLTPQEYRVALAAAQGSTNRHIAEQMCVTLRAVEFHLSGAYRKLGVKRHGLAAALLPHDRHQRVPIAA